MRKRNKLLYYMMFMLYLISFCLVPLQADATSTSFTAAANTSQSQTVTYDPGTGSNGAYTATANMTFAAVNSYTTLVVNSGVVGSYNDTVAGSCATVASSTTIAATTSITINGSLASVGTAGVSAGDLILEAPTITINGGVGGPSPALPVPATTTATANAGNIYIYANTLNINGGSILGGNGVPAFTETTSPYTVHAAGTTGNVYIYAQNINETSGSIIAGSPYPGQTALIGGTTTIVSAAITQSGGTIQGGTGQTLASYGTAGGGGPLNLYTNTLYMSGGTIESGYGGNYTGYNTGSGYIYMPGTSGVETIIAYTIDQEGGTIGPPNLMPYAGYNGAYYNCTGPLAITALSIYSNGTISDENTFTITTGSFTQGYSAYLYGGSFYSGTSGYIVDTNAGGNFIFQGNFDGHINITSSINDIIFQNNANYNLDSYMAPAINYSSQTSAQRSLTINGMVVRVPIFSVCQYGVGSAQLNFSTMEPMYNSTGANMTTYFRISKYIGSSWVVRDTPSMQVNGVMTWDDPSPSYGNVNTYRVSFRMNPSGPYFVNATTSLYATIVEGAVLTTSTTAATNATAAATAATAAQTAATTAVTNTTTINNTLNNSSYCLSAIAAAIGPNITKLAGLNGATCTTTGSFTVVISATGATTYCAKVDSGSFSSWTSSNQITVSLLSGAHTITIEAKNNLGTITTGTITVWGL